jgi:hypothetical protein
MVSVYVAGKDEDALRTAMRQLGTTSASFRNGTGKRTDIILAGDRKGNNRVKMICAPSRDDDFTMGRKAKRQAQRATRAECTPQSLPY